MVLEVDDEGAVCSVVLKVSGALFGVVVGCVLMAVERGEVDCVRNRPLPSETVC